MIFQALKAPKDWILLIILGENWIVLQGKQDDDCGYKSRYSGQSKPVDLTLQFFQIFLSIHPQQVQLPQHKLPAIVEDIKTASTIDNHIS